MRIDVCVRVLLVAAAVLMAASGRADARSAPAPDTCEASIRSSPSFLWRGSSGQGYRDSAPAMWQEGMIRVAVAQGDCSFSLLMDPERVTLSGSAGTLAMTVSDRPGGVDLSSLPDDPLLSPFVDSGSAGDVSEFPVYLSLPSGQVVGAGEYSASVPVRLFALQDGMAKLVDEAVMEVMVSVGADLSVSAPGFIGGVADVDLGDVSLGFSKDLDFLVSGNAPVSVSLESLNGGLKHSQADIFIPYRATLSGVAVDLAYGGHLTHVELAPGREETLTLELTGQPVERPVAGEYSDTLTMVFRSDL